MRSKNAFFFFDIHIVKVSLNISNMYNTYLRINELPKRRDCQHTHTHKCTKKPNIDHGKIISHFSVHFEKMSFVHSLAICERTKAEETKQTNKLTTEIEKNKHEHRSAERNRSRTNEKAKTHRRTKSICSPTNVCSFWIFNSSLSLALSLTSLTGVVIVVVV